MISVIIACLFIASGLWGLYVGLSDRGNDDAAAILVLSGFLVLCGAGYLIHVAGLLGRLLPDTAENEATADAVVPAWVERPEPEDACFSVIGGLDDETALDRVESFLERDPRVESVISETGRWYSVPDRDELPEWIALRVYSGTKDRDALMAMTRTYLDEKLGVDLRVDYF